MKKLLAIGLSMLLALGTLCGCGGSTSSSSEPVDFGTKPDYSASTKQFEFFANTAPTNGKWYVDGVEYDGGEDFRTTERYKEYKDAGLSILQIAGRDEVNSSNVDHVLSLMDKAYAAGIDKIILKDARIYNMLYGTTTAEKEKKIQDMLEMDEAVLDAKIAEYMADYKDHPAFYGISILDEPSYMFAEAYGKQYKSIKRVMPECFVLYNLFPMLPVQSAAYGPEIEGFEGTEEEYLFARYEQYVETFLDAMGCDHIQYDDYPMNVGEISPYFIPCLQICAKIAKERDIELCVMTQTFNMYVAGEQAKRKMSENDAIFLNNILLGFGVKRISYFTYFTRPDNSSSGETFMDGQSFIKRNGEKTELYYYMQKIMAQNQTFAPYILSFKFTANKFYTFTPTHFRSTHAVHITDMGAFTALKNCIINKECAMVTELYDAEKDNYMYMVMNLVDPLYKGSKAFQTTTLTFDAQYNYVMIYKNGEFTYHKLDENHSINVKAAAGEANFVLPY